MLQALKEQFDIWGNLFIHFISGLDNLSDKYLTEGTSRFQDELLFLHLYLDVHQWSSEVLVFLAQTVWLAVSLFYGRLSCLQVIYTCFALQTL